MKYIAFLNKNFPSYPKNHHLRYQKKLLETIKDFVEPKKLSKWILHFDLIYKYFCHIDSFATRPSKFFRNIEELKK